MNAQESRTAKVKPGRRRRPGLELEKAAQNIGIELLGLTCRLLVVSLGLGAALGVAAIFDVNA
jgi:hypothetical protein